VAAARTLIAPPEQIALDPESKPAEIGWIVHCSPNEILLSGLTVKRRDDGRLAAIVEVIQTRPQSCKASLRFVHDVDSAFALEGELVNDDPINVVLPSEKAKDPVKKIEPIEDDVVRHDDDIASGPESPISSSHESSQETSDSKRKLRSLKTDGDGVSLTVPGHGVVTLLVLFDEAVS
jgi:hypothetical protein